MFEAYAKGAGCCGYLSLKRTSVKKFDCCLGNKTSSPSDTLPSVEHHSYAHVSTCAQVPIHGANLRCMLCSLVDQGRVAGSCKLQILLCDYQKSIDLLQLLSYSALHNKLHIKLFLNLVCPCYDVTAITVGFLCI